MCGLYGGICIDAEHAADFMMTVTMMEQHSEERGEGIPLVSRLWRFPGASYDGDEEGASVNTCDPTTPTPELSTGTPYCY
jgi:hypothetical protein